MIKNFFRK